MTIPKDILEKWSMPGKNEVSKQTYENMKKIIKNNVTDAEIFLQGSYANSTNVRDNSDIDIVVIFKENIKYINFIGSNSVRDNVYSKINGKYNFQFTKGSKTIKYEGNADYVPVDIIPCVEYNDGKHIGIKIYDHKTKKDIISYPKQHIENGKLKSNDTDGNYKKAVRMFKNARNYAVYKEMFGKHTCPSYCLECLLHNVPDNCFEGNESNIFYNVLEALKVNVKNPLEIPQQNGILNLLGCNPCWGGYEAILSIQEINKIWNNWDKIQ